MKKQLVLFLICCLGASVVPAREGGVAEIDALADLAAQILNCSVHPCLDDTGDTIDGLLADKIVTDDVYYYSNVAVAYPQIRGVLSGLVEWDLNGLLKEDVLLVISFKLVDFHSSPEVLLHELEQALPGCEMEQDEDVNDDRNGKTWSCLARAPSEQDYLVEVFFAPGLVILELGN